jgi:dTDP-4-dehydrorhamnose 3,5-epimerase
VRFLPTALPGVLLVEPDVHRDRRGFFLETYHLEKYRDGGVEGTFVQDNHSRSGRGTLRGLHAQVRRPQGKLVRAVDGEMFDVAVDIRRGSPTFGRHAAVELSAQSGQTLYVPEGFAHGYCTLAPDSEVLYKLTAYHHPPSERGLAFDDPALGIDWRLPLSALTLSDKDRKHPRLAEMLRFFD